MVAATARSRPYGPTPFITAAVSSCVMPPDACSQRRNRKALRAPRSSILTFDESQLRLALSSDFNIAWLMPGESLVSILWKFVCANALPGDVLLRLLNPDGDPQYGVAPRRDTTDIALLRHLVRLPQRS